MTNANTRVISNVLIVFMTNANIRMKTVFGAVISLVWCWLQFNSYSCKKTTKNSALTENINERFLLHLAAIRAPAHRTNVTYVWLKIYIHFWGKIMISTIPRTTFIRLLLTDIYWRLSKESSQRNYIGSQNINKLRSRKDYVLQLRTGPLLQRAIQASRLCLYIIY